jgi:hypothetical protein
LKWADALLPSFLTSALDGRKWITWHPGRVTWGEEPPVTHRRWGWASRKFWRSDKCAASVGTRPPDYPAYSLTTLLTRLL